jgi:hypothetical protein
MSLISRPLFKIFQSNPMPHFLLQTWKKQTIDFFLAILTGIFCFPALVNAQSLPMSPNLTLTPTAVLAPSPISALESIPMATEATDPLHSPFPIPWTWILKTQADVEARQKSELRYYRTPALVSPDGQYAAYARLRMEATPSLHTTRITSVLFLENLQTGKLQIIHTEIPFSPPDVDDLPGWIAVAIPVSWSADGDRLLSRQFHGILSSSDASDAAVIWDRQTQQATTLIPNIAQEDDEFTSILLGWNRYEPDRVLFQAGVLGDEDWAMWSVAKTGETAQVAHPASVTFGQAINYSWTGSQALR